MNINKSRPIWRKNFSQDIEVILLQHFYKRSSGCPEQSLENKSKFVFLSFFLFCVIIDLSSSTGTSSLSQAVHAALANVIQDPLITATGDNTCVSHHSSFGGDGDSTGNNSIRCENCSKLRQQLTLLIYEVLNLENTMESKICEYVQRRLSEIAISEQLTTTKVNENIKSIDSTLTSNDENRSSRLALCIS